MRKFVFCMATGWGLHMAYLYFHPQWSTLGAFAAGVLVTSIAVAAWVSTWRVWPG